MIARGVAAMLVGAAAILAGCGSGDDSSEEAFEALERCIETAKTNAELDSCMRWAR